MACSALSLETRNRPHEPAVVVDKQQDVATPAWRCRGNWATEVAMDQLQGLLRLELCLLREWRAPLLPGKASIAQLVGVHDVGSPSTSPPGAIFRSPSSVGVQAEHANTKHQEHVPRRGTQDASGERISCKGDSVLGVPQLEPHALVSHGEHSMVDGDIIPALVELADAKDVAVERRDEEDVRERPWSPPLSVRTMVPRPWMSTIEPSANRTFPETERSSSTKVSIEPVMWLWRRCRGTSPHCACHL